MSSVTASQRVSPLAADERDESLVAATRALDVLAPTLGTLLADPAISTEAAMYVIVMKPGADPTMRAFDDAVLIERRYGNPSAWQADYAWYAREKTRLAWREQTTLRTLFAEHPERLRDGDIRVEGAVRQDRWIVGASGAQAWYDHAVATMVIALIEAAIAQRTHAGQVE
ncbi:MAG TPA: hypothetical protein VKV24_03460 [Casimicrobiaceae bacterium]|nr:hypothetical protein [Casimicrobiaceae bacterium]